ncbi:MAG: glycosyltransferase family 4 protein [Victivallales bacterium]|nr:glycosyltransferase family 4 protein [Victivallales bacterium]
MRIAIVCGIYPPEGGGGIETYTRDLTEALAKAGHAPVILSRTEGEERCEEVDGVTVRRYRMRELPKGERFLPGICWSRFLAREIDRLHREQPFDVVEFPNWEGVGYWYARRPPTRRLPVITRLHTPFLECLELEPARKNHMGAKFTCWLERRAVLAADRLICSTRAHAGMMAKVYGFDPAQVHVIPLGTMLPGDEAIAAIPPPAADAPVRVLYVGRLEMRKGTVTLLDAVPGVVSEFPNVEFLIAGKDRPEGPGGQYFADYFRTAYGSFAKHVKFLGFVPEDELRRLYQQCDVFAVPSNYESFGLVFLEAMAWGKPVIGCRAGGMPEVIADGETGFLAEPGDVSGLGTMLARLCGDRDLRARLGAAARRRAVEHFDRARMAARMATFVAELTHGG